MGKKPILCVDFDGVLHSYTSPWKDAVTIPDEPVPGAMKFLVDANDVFEVNVYSSRSSQIGGINAMQAYLAGHLIGHVPESIYGNPNLTGGGEPTMRALYFVTQILHWPTQKPAAFLTIDDRAVCFEGTFPDPAALIAFKPWNKRGEKNDPPTST